ncbi:MAG: DNA polymerase III subunit beta [Candidatus Dadabacteria bacterium]|nr:DNA polymerase III subunit beta [Candidatus Dadabacteria bacterium]
MEVTFKRQALIEKMSVVIGLTESHSPNETLRHVLVRCSAKRKECFLAATDLESTIVSRFAPEESPSADFEFLVSGQKFLDIVRQMDVEEVSINIHKNNWVEITTPSANFKFPCSPAKDFPKIPAAPATATFSVAPSAISVSLQSLLNFAEDEAVRRNINGVLFERAGDCLRFVATDSHRLAYFQRKVDFSGDLESFLVTRKAVVEMAKVLRLSDRDEEREATFSSGNGKVFFTVGGTTIISTPVDMPFPEYTRVIPDLAAADFVLVGRTGMQGTVRRVGIFADDPKKIDLSFGESAVSVSSGKTTSGEATETVSYAGGELKEEARMDVSFNPAFLTDSLNFLDGDEVEFYPGGGKGPSVMKLSGSEDFICVLMPVVS